jgi:hypothetical protein
MPVVDGLGAVPTRTGGAWARVASLHFAHPTGCELEDYFGGQGPA